MSGDQILALLGRKRRQMSGVCPGGGMLKLRFDWYITFGLCDDFFVCQSPGSVYALFFRLEHKLKQVSSSRGRFFPDFQHLSTKFLKVTNMLNWIYVEEFFDSLPKRKHGQSVDVKWHVEYRQDLLQQLWVRVCLEF